MVFSERYKDLIDVGHGEAKDNICGEIAFAVKKEIAKVLTDFAEPAIIKPDRYDSYEVHTSAFHLAIDKLNETIGFPVISLTRNVFDGCNNQDVFGNIFTPWLFDHIELQYSELSDGEKKEFQAAINIVFKNNDIPWILCDGLMVKIDTQQFELDLRAKALIGIQRVDEGLRILGKRKPCGSHFKCRKELRERVKSNLWYAKRQRR